jgi:hypothetical protein
MNYQQLLIESRYPNSLLTITLVSRVTESQRFRAAPHKRKVDFQSVQSIRWQKSAQLGKT